MGDAAVDSTIGALDRLTPVGFLVNSGAEQVISSTSSLCGVPEIGARASDIKEENDRLPGAEPDEEPVQPHPAARVQVRSQVQHNAATRSGGGWASKRAEELDLALQWWTMEEIEEKRADSVGVLDDHEALGRLDQISAGSRWSPDVKMVGKQ